MKRLSNIFQKKVLSFPPEQVTTIGHETSPHLVGLEAKDIESIWDSVVELYKTRLHPAMALCIRKEGKVVLHRTIGHSHGNSPEDSLGSPKTLVTPDTLFNIYSISKVITSMLIHLLDQRGELHLDDAVEHYIPEFGQNGKRKITIRHILTHRAGIPAVPGKHADPNLLTQPERILELLCESKPISRPGKRLAYHALTGGYILAEIIRRVTGQPIQEFLQKEITQKMGVNYFDFGVKEQDIHRVATNAYTGPPPLFPYGAILKRSLGADIRDAVEVSNDKRFLTSVIPSGNICCTASDLGLFFEMLLNGGMCEDQAIFDKRTVKRAVSEQSYLELDAVLMMPIRYGMGLMLGGKHWSFFGPRTSHAFGHLGFTNMIAYACPERNISVSFLNTGKPFITPDALKWFRVMNTIGKVFPRQKNFAF